MFPLTDPTERQAKTLQECNLTHFAKEMKWLSEVSSINSFENPVINIANEQLKAVKKISEVHSGSYFLIDAEGKNVAIIKPADEEIGKVRRPKLIAPDSCTLREAICYYIAQKVTHTHPVPMTLRCYMQCEKFGGPCKVKLVSIQKMVPDAKSWVNLAKTAIFTESLLGALRVHYLTDNSDGHFYNILGTTDEHGKVLIYDIDNSYTFTGLTGSCASALIDAPQTTCAHQYLKIDPLQLKQNILLAFPEIEKDRQLLNAIDILTLALEIETRLFANGYSVYFVAALFLSSGVLPGLPGKSSFFQNLYKKCDEAYKLFSKEALKWIDALIQADQTVQSYFSTAPDSIRLKVADILYEHPKNCKFASFPTFSILNMEDVLQNDLGINTLGQRLTEQLLLTLAYQEVLEKETDAQNQEISIKILCQDRKLHYLKYMRLNFEDPDFKQHLKASGWEFKMENNLQETLSLAYKVMLKIHKNALET